MNVSGRSCFHHKDNSRFNGYTNERMNMRDSSAVKHRQQQFRAAFETKSVRKQEHQATVFYFLFFNDHCFDFFEAKPQINSLTDYVTRDGVSLPLYYEHPIGSWLDSVLACGEKVRSWSAACIIWCVGGGSSLYERRIFAFFQLFKLYSSKTLTHLKHWRSTSSYC